MKKWILAIAVFCLPMVVIAQFWEHHWIADNYVFTGSGGDALTVSQTNCEEGLVEVTAPSAAPLPAFSPIIINPQNLDGEEITDITAFSTSLTMRARSTAQVIVGALFRSDDGSSNFRTSILYDTIPAGLESWTEITIEFTGDDLAGFNPDNLRDFWFFLDRGTENFAGNELYIDYISLGGLPTPGLESTCAAGSNPNAIIFATYFSGSTIQNINTGSTAGQVSTFTLDTICETLQISVTDPESSPLPAFNAYQLNPFDENGNEVTDISGQVNLSMRVRSAESVQLDVLFRSGEGSQAERTRRKAITIPGDLENWTSFTLEFSEAEYEGFNPADLRDMWFYIDRGVSNFSGNEFYIDHIVIGGEADSTRNSPCAAEIRSQTWQENWNTDHPIILGGAETAKLSLRETECEELKLEVSDPTNDPHLAFRPIVIQPVNESGAVITDISDNIQVIIRARSAEEVPVGVLFRSGDGSGDFRTATLTQNVRGSLEAWSTLTYTFSEEDLQGFDPEDLVDLWIFLDRENNNFPGNEIYFDYIAIGEQPDSTEQSPCELPDITATTNSLDWVAFFEVFPNPVEDELQIRFNKKVTGQDRYRLRLLNVSGQLLFQQDLPGLNDQLSLNVSAIPDGILFLQISNRQHHFTRRLIKK
ncbi:MAG TPA: T9SS type A sorting domain-containing protein [Saprospiraceae bacterium]|nr:T9SS type A sorting domain-containing protein [Saprospiraceae bacterium]